MQLASLTPLLVLLAFWPVLHWYVLRTLDRSDEPWGLLALLTAAVFFWIEHRGRNGKDRSSAQPAVGSPGEPTRFSILNGVGFVSLFVYMVTFSIAPSLVQSIMLVVTAWCLMGSRLPSPSKSGLFGLLILGLPLIPSISFFGNYPLRLLVSSGTCGMLRCLGVPLMQDGVMLSMAGHQFAIDAPCSGVNMLWAEGYVAMVLACVFRLNLKGTLLLATSGFFLVMVGNIFRAASLVMFDLLGAAAYLPQENIDADMHVGIGLLTFTLATVATCFAATEFARHQKFKSSSARPVSVSPPASVEQLNVPPKIGAHALARHALVPLCIAAAMMPFFARPSGSRIATMPPPQWPTVINGMPVLPVESLSEEKAFAADFPGHMKRFTDGHNLYFVRVVNRETRQLHPSGDCFRGLGYAIEPQPLIVTKDGAQWSSFEASKDGRKYRVMERIYDDAGNTWSDVSQWYWQAALSKSSGPWWSVTIAQPL